MGIETRGIGDPSLGNPSVCGREIESFFREHRLADDQDLEVFGRFRELPARMDEMTPDRLIALIDLAMYLSGRVHTEGDTRGRLSLPDRRKVQRLVDDLNDRAWDALKKLRPQEAKEIAGVPGMDTFSSASNRYATITRETAGILDTVESCKAQGLALKKALRKRSLTEVARNALLRQAEENEARLNASLAILEKRPKEID